MWSLKAFDFIEDMRAGGRYDEDKIDDEYSRCCGGIGNVYCEMGDYEKSIEYYLKALEIFEKHNWIESKTILYGNLGYLYEETGDFKEAGRCLLKCMENAKSQETRPWWHSVIPSSANITLKPGNTKGSKGVSRSGHLLFDTRRRRAGKASGNP